MSSDGGTPEELAALQRELNLTAAAKNTRDLRHSDEPRWRRLRQRLEQEGLAIEDAVVADKNTEDTSLEFGIVVARDGRAFSFEFDWLRDEEGRELAYEDARVSSWEEIDQWRKETTYGRELEIGREILKREKPSE
jgi:hypothetical protein